MALDDGSYTITETTKPGYTVTSECLIGGEVVSSGGVSVSVAVADDVTATCIFTNTLNTGTFTVNKNFLPDHIDAVLMTLACSSGDIVDDTLFASELLPAEFTITGFLPGATCTATEAPTPGYTQDISSCQAGGLLADGGSCTMVNTQRTGTFTVNKDYVPDHIDAVLMTLECSSGDIVDDTLEAVDGGPDAVFTINGFLPDATCTATEAATPGYDQDTSDCQAADLSAVDGSCTMVNTAVPNVVFRVTKDFTDDNPMEVKVNIDCNGGDPLQSDSMIRDAIGPDGFVDFVVNYYTVGELTCEIWESPVPGGYNDTYEASELIEGSAASLSGGEDRCQFVEVTGGNFFCHITNTPNLGKLEVTKEWVVEGAAGNKLYFDASIDVRSTGEIDGGQVCDDGWCTWLNYEGPATDTQTVLIHTDYLGRWVGLHEKTRHSDFEVDNSCGGGNTGSVRVYPEGFDGQPDIARCTFTNTVYFEGIPTLNQYGLALLALLMLGMGAVGFRRFV